jgi:hypothetical protein
MSDTEHERLEETGLEPGSERFQSDRDTEQAHWVRQGAALVGMAFLVVGLAGFVPGVTSGLDDLRISGHESGALLLGAFQVSILLNVVHLLFGVVGLGLARTTGHAVLFLLGGGVAQLLLAYHGLVVDGHPSDNVLSLNAADNWLHLGVGAALVLLGLLGLLGLRAAVASGEPVELVEE